MSVISDLLDSMNESEKQKWYQAQIALATLMIAGLIRRFDLSRSLQIPDPHDVVHETIVRIDHGSNPRYVWDNLNPPTLTLFFARCMRTTIFSYRSKERSHSKRQAPLSELHKPKNSQALAVAEAVEAELSGDALSCRLEEILADRRVYGKTVQYLRNLQDYANRQATPEEVAHDLGVQRSTIETLRKRSRALIEDSRDKTK
ncbi:hypothetical protein [Bradyrhizobium oligotrophicum]|uniref:hypothetical protein n=1 Tax=Bradyrhizobium oligotrophicum TaxID=44255 RepID=UPI003EBBC379